MDKLKIAHRLYLSIAVSLLLIAVLTYYFVDSVQTNVDFAVQESYGDAYQRPLTQIMADLADYEILGSLPEHQNERAGLLAKKTEAVTAGFSALKQVHAE